MSSGHVGRARVLCGCGWQGVCAAASRKCGLKHLGGEAVAPERAGAENYLMDAVPVAVF